MKERPIIFSAPMVFALLAGTKTQTRRVCKVQPSPWKNHYQEGGCHVSDWEPAQCDDGAWDLISGYADNSDKSFGRCPYGAPGDRLWVRETWAIPDDLGPASDVAYRADIPPDAESDERWVRRVMQPAARWRPSIHMPRAFSRITLEITDVRVERLQSISEEDARAEGVTLDVVHICPCKAMVDVPGAHIESCPYRDIDFEPTGSPLVDRFSALWTSINGKTAPWSSNPWVWAITFTRST